MSQINADQLLQALLQAMQGTQVKAKIPGSVASLAGKGMNIEAKQALSEQEIAANERLKAMQYAAANENVRIREAEKRMTLEQANELKIRLIDQRERIKAAERETEQRIKAIDLQTLKARRDELVTSAQRVIARGPDDPAVKGAIDALETSEFDKVNGKAFAGALKSQATIQQQRTVRRVWEREAPKFKAAGVEPPTLDQVEEAVKSNKSPFRFLDEERAARVAQKVGAAEVDAFVAAEIPKVEKLLGPAKAAQIREAINPAKSTPVVDAKQALNREVNAALSSRNWKRGLIGAGGAALAAMIASKVMGKGDGPSLSPEQQMMMAQALQSRQQDDGAATSKTLMDMNRLLGLVSKLQTMAGMQTQPTSVAQLI